MASLPPLRRVRCDFCGARRGNRCRDPHGRPVDYHHSARYDLAERPAHLGAPRRALPAHVHAWSRQGMALREIERLSGISRTMLRRHGLTGRREPRQEAA
jgi:hypothetical protein